MPRGKRIKVRDRQPGNDMERGITPENSRWPVNIKKILQYATDQPRESIRPEYRASEVPLLCTAVSDYNANNKKTVSKIGLYCKKNISPEGMSCINKME